MWESALVAEDHHHTAQYIAEQLAVFGYAADIAATAEEAVEMCRQKRYQLACLDVYLGGTKPGYWIVQFLRQQDDQPPTAVIYITGSTDFDVVRACWTHGGEEYLVKPIAPEALLQATHRATEKVQRQWSEQLMHAARGLLGIYIATGDKETFEHSLRVGRATLRVARAFGWCFTERLIVYLAGLLHDIGKAYVGAKVLHSPLNAQQWPPESVERLRHHPVVGAEAAKSAGLPDKVVHAIRRHHERLDGLGYPANLRREDLNQIDLLVAAADVTDALMSNRPYRPVLDNDEAAAELRRIAGTQLASRWANHFAEVVEQGRFCEVFRTPLNEKELASICAPTDWILYA